MESKYTRVNLDTLKTNNMYFDTLNFKFRHTKFWIDESGGSEKSLNCSVDKLLIH
jgi:hypothetical protein